MKLKEEKRDRSSVDIEFEKQQEHCTFHPATKTTSRFDQLQQNLSQLTKKSTKRKVTPTRAKKKKAKKQTPVKEEVEYPVEAAQVSITEDFTDLCKKAAASKPILFLDVNLSSGVERLVVNEGDSPREVAAQFCLQHGLDERKQRKLNNVLKVQLEVARTDKISERNTEEEEDQQSVLNN